MIQLTVSAWWYEFFSQIPAVFFVSVEINIGATAAVRVMAASVELATLEFIAVVLVRRLLRQPHPQPIWLLPWQPMGRSCMQTHQHAG